MLVKRQRLPDTLQPHHLETHRIGETQLLIAKTPQPPVDRASLEIAINKHDFVRRILIQAVKKMQSVPDTAIAAQQNLHLGDDEIGGYKPRPGLDMAHVLSTRRPMVRLLDAQCGEPAGRIEKKRAHTRFFRDPRYDSASTAS